MTPGVRWNLGEKKCELQRHLLPLEGIKTPYVYVGKEGSVYCIHVEDMLLHSVNYLHSGKPKIWFIVRPTSYFNMKAWLNVRVISFMPYIFL